MAPSALVCEPLGRSTAAVSVIAAELAGDIHPGALVLLLPSDHRIADAAGFRAVVRGASVAATDHIVTFGVEPSRPETGFGYIQRRREIVPGVYRVGRFAEKPDGRTARDYVAAGYLWTRDFPIPASHLAG